MHVLFVNEDVAASSGLCGALRIIKGIADQASTGEEGIKLVGLHDYDAVVLEMTLPDMDGLEAIRRMRAAKMTMPILVIAAKDGSEIKVRAFGLGADDFLTKPYDPGELTARLQAIVRRSRRGGKANLQVGPLELDVAAQDVWVNSKRIKLTAMEFAVLELLLLRKGSTLSKEAILGHLYGGLDVPDMNVVDVFVYRLRKKLYQFGVADMIGTVWSRGYILYQPKVAAETTSFTSVP